MTRYEELANEDKDGLERLTILIDKDKNASNFSSIFIYQNTHKNVEYRSQTYIYATEYRTMYASVSAAKEYLRLNNSLPELADNIWNKFQEKRQLKLFE